MLSYTRSRFIAPQTDPLTCVGKVSVQKKFTFMLGILICKISLNFEIGRINSWILLPEIL